MIRDQSYYYRFINYYFLQFPGVSVYFTLVGRALSLKQLLEPTIILSNYVLRKSSLRTITELDLEIESP